MITGMLPVNCSIPVFIIGVNNILIRKRYLLCGKQKQAIENFRREQERNGDREKKKGWHWHFFFPAFWVWSF